MDDKKVKESIKKDWFENHVAEFQNINDRISILEWYKPGSGFYYTRYVFDGGRLYISGDIGEAVFLLTEKASIESIKKYSVDYFHKKMSAYSESKYSFDSETAMERINKEIKYASEDKDYDDNGNELLTKNNEAINNYIASLKSLLAECKTCDSKGGWEFEVDKRYDDLSSYNSDIYEWIYNVGDVIPIRVYGYLIGIQMAAEQLSI